jgi:hypothetical protein
MFSSHDSDGLLGLDKALVGSIFVRNWWWYVVLQGRRRGSTCICIDDWLVKIMAWEILF